jgi:hypothetical protein
LKSAIHCVSVARIAACAGVSPCAAATEAITSASALLHNAARTRPESEGTPHAHFIVGMTNSAPSLVPDGQREVTVLVLV